MRYIQHAIDFVPGTQLPNLAHHRMAPCEQQELQRLDKELINNGYTRIWEPGIPHVEENSTNKSWEKYLPLPVLDSVVDKDAAFSTCLLQKITKIPSF